MDALAGNSARSSGTRLIAVVERTRQNHDPHRACPAPRCAKRAIFPPASSTSRAACWPRRSPVRRATSIPPDGERRDLPQEIPGRDHEAR